MGTTTTGDINLGLYFWIPDPRGGLYTALYSSTQQSMQGIKINILSLNSNTGGYTVGMSSTFNVMVSSVSYSVSFQVTVMYSTVTGVSDSITVVDFKVQDTNGVILPAYATNVAVTNMPGNTTYIPVFNCGKPMSMSYNDYTAIGGSYGGNEYNGNTVGIGGSTTATLSLGDGTFTVSGVMSDLWYGVGAGTGGTAVYQKLTPTSQSQLAIKVYPYVDTTKPASLLMRMSQDAKKAITFNRHDTYSWTVTALCPSSLSTVTTPSCGVTSSNIVISPVVNCYYKPRSFNWQVTL